MNCEEVSKHLTEYLDKTLDTAMTTRVATHVISCALCRAESNELADCIHQVATLPALDPPLGFAQRVMAHARDTEVRPSLWQRLLLPLTSRVPVRATALAVVAICAIALFQKEQPLKQNSDVNLALRSQAQTPVKETKISAASVPPSADLKDRANEAKKTATATVPATVENLANAGTALRAGLSVPAQSQQAKATSTTTLRAEIESSGEEIAVAPKRPPLRVQEVTTARDNSSIFGDSRGFSGPLPTTLGALRQAELRPTAMALERATSFGDRAADFEFIVRRRAPQQRDQAENLSGADSQQKSNDPENPSQPASRPPTAPAPRAKIESIAEIRFYNVAPEHFDIFKKDLAAESNIESEPKVNPKEIEAARQADRQLLVKVTILPAEQAAPSR